MNLTVILRDVSVDIQIDENSPDNLIDILMNAGIYVAANCGRMGICGKCDVFVRELGKRMLACKIDKEWLTGYDKLSIEISNYMLDSDMKIEEDFKAKELNESEYNQEDDMQLSDGDNSDYSSRHLSMAIDVGTTTIVYALVNNESGRVLDTCSRVNSQRRFGSDVISRIKEACNGKLDVLNKCIVDDIISGMNKICTDNGIDFADLASMVIVGNTTMCHILMGYKCDGLGVYPYTPVRINTIYTDTGKLLGIQDMIPVLIPPGFTAYVGADIASGVLAVLPDIRRFGLEDSAVRDKADETFIMIDLGTNAEMVLCSGEEFFVTSSAAGPAFEGVNISCGVPSIEGAISHFELTDAGVSVDTIGAAKPIGICGSGLVDVIYELRKNDIIDENGTLIDRYIEDGYKIYKDIVLLQEDIRQFQLAKAAIRSGIEILLEESGMIYSDVDRLYISGGFGSSIDVDKAASIGIIPKALRSKAQAVGNSGIGGAVRLAISTSSDMPNAKADSSDVNIDYLESITSSAKEINLSEHNNFQDIYMRSMCVERED